MIIGIGRNTRENSGTDILRSWHYGDWYQKEFGEPVFYPFTVIVFIIAVVLHGEIPEPIFSGPGITDIGIKKSLENQFSIHSP